MTRAAVIATSLTGLLSLGGLGACATEEEVEPVAYDERLGTPESPLPQEDAYRVKSRLDLGFEPAKLAAAVADFEALAGNPARVLLAQGGSGVGELLAALPAALDDRLEGWLNVEIDKQRILGKTPRQFATDIAAFTETTLTQFTLESSLSITPGGVVHSLMGLNFRPSGLDIIIPIGGLKADALTQRTEVEVGTGGALWLGEQRFNLAFGTHAWQGLNLASSTLYGTDLATALDDALGCPAVATAVATRCYNGTCVGHASQLQAICERAASTIVTQLSERITAFELAGIHFVQGTATLVDTNRNGVAETISGGAWAIEVDLGAGPRAATGTFLAQE
jgi:hypothetical protein